MTTTTLCYTRSPEIKALLSYIENGEVPMEILTPAQQDVIIYMIHNKKKGKYPGAKKIARVFKTSTANVYKRLQLAEHVVFGRKETKSHELSINAQKLLEVIHHMEKDPAFEKKLSEKEKRLIHAYTRKKAKPVSLREIPEQIDTKSVHVFRRNILRKFDREKHEK